MQPVAQSERYASLDTLRGMALFGVLIVNLLTLFRVSLFAHMLGTDTPADATGQAVMGLVSILIEFKAFSLFSFLFGVGVALQAGRAVGRGAGRFLLRRFLVLLAIGLVHLLLIWNGDILTLYAVCGLLLIPLLRMGDAALAVAGVAAIVISHFAPLPVSFPEGVALRAQAAHAARVYAEGGFAEILAFRWHETRVFIAPLLILTLPKTLGLMLLGVAAWRRGLLVERRRVWLAVSWAGSAIGIAGTVLGSSLAAHVPLALAYAAAILLWIRSAPLFAAAGQMALTNYLMQSVVFGFVFLGYGLGLFGRVGETAAAAGGVAFYGMQLVFSRWWLRRFHFGPVEWFWRSLTYGRRQPMVREEEMTLSRGGMRVLLVAVFLVGLPVVHAGLPWLLASVGPRWGWAGGRPSAANLTGLLPIGLAILLVVWILAAALGEVPSMPARIPAGLRPVRLLQAGPYGRTRHPIYLAESWLWLGFAVFFGSPVVFAALVTGSAVVVQIVIPREERALEQQFGEEYRAYKKRVPSAVMG